MDCRGLCLALVCQGLELRRSSQDLPRAHVPKQRAFFWSPKCYILNGLLGVLEVEFLGCSIDGSNAVTSTFSKWKNPQIANKWPCSP